MTSAPDRSVRLVALVAAGGAVGSTARYGVGLVLGAGPGWPWGTFAVNLVGAFALGVLLEALLVLGPETPGRRRWRLGAGTGFLGGFTTFSALALEAEGRLADQPVLAVSYVVVSVLAGLLLAFAGVLVGARLGGSRAR